MVIAHGDNETSCEIYSIDRRQVITAWTVPSYVDAAVLSPDGKTVVTRHNAGGATYLWSVKDIGNPTKLFPNGDDVDFSRDGQHLVMDDHNRHELAIVDVTTGTTDERLVGHRHDISSIQFSPDGKRVATGANDGVKIWDFATRRELLTLETHGWYHRQVEWSPDGNSILVISGSGKLSLWRVPTTAGLPSSARITDQHCWASQQWHPETGYDSLPEVSRWARASMRSICSWNCAAN